jgi:hypothetical protein
MSIYATLYDFAVRRFGENNYHLLRVQGVPAHIQHTGPGWDWLPPPIADGSDTESDGPARLRAVVIVEEGTSKGTTRCGQEYVDPLLVLSGDDWERASFADVMSRVELELARRYGDSPSIIVFSPSGKMTKIFKDDGPVSPE